MSLTSSIVIGLMLSSAPAENTEIPDLFITDDIKHIEIQQSSQQANEQLEVAGIWEWIFGEDKPEPKPRRPSPEDEGTVDPDPDNDTDTDTDRDSDIDTNPSTDTPSGSKFWG